MKTLAGLLILVLLAAGAVLGSAVLIALGISGVEHYAALVAALAHLFGA